MSILDQGETCRNLLLYLIDNNYLFDGNSTSQLNTHYGFDTAYMSEIETPIIKVAPQETTVASTVPSDAAAKHMDVPISTPTTAQAQTPTTISTPDLNPNSSPQAQKIRKVLVDSLGFKPEHISDTDTEIVLWACRTVATRAARLSGCAVAAVMEQTNNKGEDAKPIDVGVDGR